jgi:hypothetical protein
MLHRTQQLRIDAGQPGQRPRIQTIVFFAALPDQPQLARIRHDHFVPQLAQQAADPGRMRPGLQRDPATRHPAEDFVQRFRTRPHALLQLDLAAFIQHAIPTVTISHIQSHGQFLPRNIPARLRPCGLTFFIAGLLFICASSTSITWERTPHPVRRPAFSSHLVSTVTSVRPVF